VDLQTAVVVNKAQFPEPVHEADPRAGSADHFRQRLLTDLRDYGFRNAFLAKMSEQQKDPGQPLFARIEKLINQIWDGLDQFSSVGKKAGANEFDTRCLPG
jgi:hypothetical protein